MTGPLPGDDKPARILAAAGQMIIAHGLEFSMSTLARNAGIATGSVYNYFPSKDALVLAVHQSLTHEVEAALIVPFDDNNPKAAIEAYFQSYISFFWENPDRAMLFEYFSNIPLLRQSPFGEAFAPLSAHAGRLFGAARRAGLLREMDVHDMSAGIGGMIRNTLKWRRASARAFSGADRDAILAMCWAAIAAEVNKTS